MKTSSLFMLMSPTMTHHEGVVHLDDVTAEQWRPQFGDSDGLSLPYVAHPRDDVVSSNCRQFLTELLNKIKHRIRDQSFSSTGLLSVMASGQEMCITLVCPSAMYECLAMMAAFGTTIREQVFSNLALMLISSPSQNPFLSIWALMDTWPSGMNIQVTFFCLEAAAGAWWGTESAGL